MATVLLVRHGRTTANASGVLAGWSPGIDLDDTGREQATALAARLVDVSVVEVVSSPLTRCLQTVDLLRRGAWSEVPMTEHDDLGECRYGDWTGRSLAELTGEPLWSTVQQHPSAATFPASDEFRHESIREMSARAITAVRATDARIEAQHGPGAVWVAVSHGDVVKALLADAAGAHLDSFQRFTVGPASLSIVRYTGERPYLVRMNDTGNDLGFLAAPAPAGSKAAADAASGSSGVVGGGV